MTVDVKGIISDNKLDAKQKALFLAEIMEPGDAIRYYESLVTMLKNKYQGYETASERL